jgi:hypothetical protein
MADLARDRLRSLFEIVKSAKANGEILPTVVVVANILGIGEIIASARLKRLIHARPEDFIVEGRVRKINYGELTAGSETA